MCGLHGLPWQPLCIACKLCVVSHVCKFCGNVGLTNEYKNVHFFTREYIPIDVMQEGGAKPRSELKSPWHIHLHDWRADHPDVAYKEALKLAKLTYVSAAQAKKNAKPAKPVKPEKKERKTRAPSDVPRTQSPWIAHIKAYQAAHPGMKYGEAMSASKATYVKKGQAPHSVPVTAAPLPVVVAPIVNSLPVEVKEVAEMSPVELKQEIKEMKEVARDDGLRDRAYEALEKKIEEEEDEGILDVEIDKAAEARAREYAMRKVIQQLDKEEEAAGNAVAFQTVLNVIYDYIGRYTDADARKTDAELFDGKLFFMGSIHDVEDAQKVTAIYHELKKDAKKLIRLVKDGKIMKVIKWVRRIWKDDPKILKLGMRPLTDAEYKMAEKTIEHEADVARADYKLKYPGMFGKDGNFVSDEASQDPVWRAIEEHESKESQKLYWAAKGKSVPTGNESMAFMDSEYTPYGKELRDAESIYNWKIPVAQGWKTDDPRYAMTDGIKLRPLTEKQIAARDAKFEAIRKKYVLEVTPATQDREVKITGPDIERQIRNWEGTAQAYRSMGKEPPLPRPSEIQIIKGQPEYRRYPPERTEPKKTVRPEFSRGDIKDYRRGHMGSGRARPRCECGKRKCHCGWVA